MDIKKQESLFKQFTPMLRSKARKFSNIYQIEYDEILSESYLIFVETCGNFDENKSCFSTYLYYMLENKLAYFCKNQKEKYVHTDILDSVIAYNDKFIESIFFKDVMENISKLAGEILNLIFNDISETNLNTKSAWRNKVTKKYIEKHFMKKGISRAKIRSAFDEIQEAISC